MTTTRRQAGLTQRQLAARLKEPYSFVSRMESGERRLDVVEFVRYAEAMKIDPLKLLARVLQW